MVLNTTAVELGLGTGGWHVVHWNLARDAWSRPGPGPHHEAALHEPAGRHRRGRGGPSRPAEHRPGGCRSWRARCTARWPWSPPSPATCAPTARIAYVMTDGAALPLALSDLVHDLRAHGHPRRDDHRRTRLRRRPRGGGGPVGPGARAPRRSAPTSRSWAWAPAWSAPPRRSARPRSRWRASSTPPPGWAPAWRCAAGPRAPTPAPATAASATTCARSSTWRRPGPSCRCRPSWPARWRGRRSSPMRPTPPPSSRPPACGSRRWAAGPAEDPPFFAAAAAAGRWAADAMA